MELVLLTGLDALDALDKELDQIPDTETVEAVLPVSGDLLDLLRGPHWSLIAYEHTEPVTLDHAKSTHMHVHRTRSALTGRPDCARVNTSLPRTHWSSH